MNRTIFSVLLAGLITLPLTAGASSTDSWSAADKAMREACMKKSNLKEVAPVGKIMLFDDSVGYSALLLEGRYRQTFMHNQKGRELCLYQRAKRQAVITEADSLLPPGSNKK